MIKTTQLKPLITFLGKRISKQSLAISLFLALCLNTLFASTIYGATGATIARNTVYALGILLLVTISLSIYLFIVIFQPERF
ncbi:potassium-transporting ATPase subunit F [Crocosphaera subtropica]|nr:potassium-transporting ATPase subunit F [Crocosphaera subtropica]